MYLSPSGSFRIDAVSTRPLDASETLLYVISKQAADTARLSKRKLRVDASSSPPTVTSIDPLGIIDIELPVSVLALRPTHTWAIQQWGRSVLILLPGRQAMHVIEVDADTMRLIATHELPLDDSLGAGFDRELFRAPVSVISRPATKQVYFDLKGHTAHIDLSVSPARIEAVQDSLFRNSTFVQKDGAVLQFVYPLSSASESTISVRCPASWKAAEFEVDTTASSITLLTGVGTVYDCAAECLSRMSANCAVFVYQENRCTIYQARGDSATGQKITDGCIRQQWSSTRDTQSNLPVRIPLSVKMHSFIHDAIQVPWQETASNLNDDNALFNIIYRLELENKWNPAQWQLKSADTFVLRDHIVPVAESPFAVRPYEGGRVWQDDDTVPTDTAVTVTLDLAASKALFALVFEFKCASGERSLTMHFNNNAQADDLIMQLDCARPVGVAEVRVEVDVPTKTIYYQPNITSDEISTTQQPLAFTQIEVSLAPGTRLVSASSISALSMLGAPGGVTHTPANTPANVIDGSWRRVGTLLSSSELAANNFAHLHLSCPDDEIAAEEAEEEQSNADVNEFLNDEIRVALDDWSITPVLSLGPAVASHARCPPGHEWDSATLSCVQCAQDHFSPGDTMPCRACAAGSWSEAGAAECSVCGEGEQFNSSKRACVAPAPPLQCANHLELNADGINCNQRCTTLGEGWDGSNCVACPDGEQAVDGLCVPCAAGKTYNPYPKTIQFTMSWADMCPDDSDIGMSDAATYPGFHNKWTFEKTDLKCVSDNAPGFETYVAQGDQFDGTIWEETQMYLYYNASESSQEQDIPRWFITSTQDGLLTDPNDASTAVLGPCVDYSICCPGRNNLERTYAWSPQTNAIPNGIDGRTGENSWRWYCNEATTLGELSTFAAANTVFKHTLECQDCRPGTYAAESATECTPCPPGTYQPSAGAAECIACQGTLSADKTACPCTGPYYDDSDLGACVICPVFSSLGTSDGCLCDAGFESATGSERVRSGDECQMCPAGMTSVPGSDPRLRAVRRPAARARRRHAGVRAVRGRIRAFSRQDGVC